MEFTGRELIIAILGSGGLIGGLFTAVAFVVGRLDKRRERKENSETTTRSETAETRRIEIEDETATDARWEKLANRYSADITGLEEKLKEYEDEVAETRPIWAKIDRGLNAMENRLQKLRVAKCPDNVVDIINERIAEVQKTIDEIRNILP